MYTMHLVINNGKAFASRTRQTASFKQITWPFRDFITLLNWCINILQIGDCQYINQSGEKRRNVIRLFYGAAAAAYKCAVGKTTYLFRIHPGRLKM